MWDGSEKSIFTHPVPENNKSDNISLEFGIGLVILELMKVFLGS